MKTDIKTLLRTIFASFLVLIVVSAPAYAQTYNSSNYQVDEVFLGSGGTNDATSASYKGRASIGDLGVGESASTSWRAFGGFTTTAAPELEMDVDVTNVDLGVLSPGTTAYTSAKFRVRTYLASNYVIYTSGAPPTSEGGAVIPGLTSGGPAAINTNQFGINLATNTTPAVGAPPSQLPSGTFSFGTVAASGKNRIAIDILKAKISQFFN